MEFMLAIILVSLPFAAIGVGVVVFLLCLLLQEIDRSIRQGARVAAVCARKYRGQRKATPKQILYAIKREFGSSYSSLVVGFVEIPRNPSKPMRARLPI